MQYKNSYIAFMSDLTPGVLSAASLSPQAENEAQLIELWLHGRSVHTQLSYRKDVGRFLTFVGKPLPQVMLREFQAFVDQLQGAPSSRRLAIAAVKSLFSFAAKIGYIRFNVAAAVRSPNSADTLAERILTEVKVQRMIALTTSRRDQMLLRVLYGSGARVSEVSGLNWRNLQENGGGGQVTVFGKGGKTRSIVLPAGLWSDLREFRGDAKDDAPVFPSRKGNGHLVPCQVWRIIRAAAIRADIKANVSPHWLRHCHASHALDRGAPITLVQVTLGHSTVAVTSRYVHARPSDSSAKYLAV
jgi:integrase/recombinase XerD